MKFYTILLATAAVAALLATACSHRQQQTKTLPAVPQMPPRPTTSETAAAVTAAKVDAAQAQTNVRAATVEARADRAAAAVPFLEKADAQLTDTQAHHDEASQRISELEQRILADRAAHDATAKAYEARVAAVQANLEAANKEKAKIAKQLADYKNEVMSKTRTALTIVSIVGLVGSIGVLAAAIWAGQLWGYKVAPIMFAVGAAAVSIAGMLAQIELIARVCIFAGVAAALAFGLYSLLKHVHLSKIEAEISAALETAKSLATEAGTAVAPVVKTIEQAIAQPTNKPAA